jgi:hypothetical protein
MVVSILKKLWWTAIRLFRLNRYVGKYQHITRKRVIATDPSFPDFIRDLNGYSDWAIYRANHEDYRSWITMIDGLDYSTLARRYQAMSAVCAINPVDLPPSPKILLVGYREDTYDAQSLVHLGYEPDVHYLDLKPAPDGEILARDLFDSFTVTAGDTNKLKALYEANSFDLVYFSRACLDLFDWTDTIQVLEAAQRISRIGVVAHLQSLFWSEGYERDHTHRDNWLVVDLLSDGALRAGLRTVVRSYLDRYALISGASRFHSVIDSTDPGDSVITNLALSRSDDEGRVVTLDALPGNAELVSMQLDSSPLTPKMGLYCSSVLFWDCRTE